MDFHKMVFGWIFGFHGWIFSDIGWISGLNGWIFARNGWIFSQCLMCSRSLDTSGHEF